MDNTTTPTTPTASSNSSLSSVVYFLTGHGTRSSKQGTLSFDGSTMTLALDDGHIVFQEPITNIKKVQMFSSLMRVIMPTGAASIYFSDPNGVMQDIEMAAVSGYVAQGTPSQLGADLAGVALANNAQTKLASHQDDIRQWNQVLQGKVKIIGSADTDIGNTSFGVIGGLSLVTAILGGICLPGSIAMIFSSSMAGLIATAISGVMLVGGFLIYRGITHDKTSFPSSR